MLHIEELKDQYTIEQVLIVLLTRLYFGTQKKEEIERFLKEESIDWQVFYNQIAINDIRGFVYEIVVNYAFSIDQDILSALKKDTMGITLFGAYQSRLLDTLIKAFEEMDVKVIPYKGIALGERYYKKSYLRESSDIDLLVSKEDVYKLSQYLIHNGYSTDYNIAKHQMGAVIHFHRELSFKSTKNKMGISCSVELQWKLIEEYFGVFQQHNFFVKHMQSYTTTSGAQRMGLRPTYDFIAVASHHLIREPLLRFKYLIDLGCIVQNGNSELDWDEIQRQFKKGSYSNFLSSGTNALTEILGLVVPKSVNTKVAYHLFTSSTLRGGLKHLYRKVGLINLKLSLIDKIRFDVNIGISFLVPSLKELSKPFVNGWTIPFIILLKIIKFPFKVLNFIFEQVVTNR